MYVHTPTHRFDRCLTDRPTPPNTGPDRSISEEIDPAETIVVRNQMARRQVLEYKEAKTRAWEALRREWEAAQQG